MCEHIGRFGAWLRPWRIVLIQFVTGDRVGVSVHRLSYTVYARGDVNYTGYYTQTRHRLVIFWHFCTPGQHRQSSALSIIRAVMRYAAGSTDRCQSRGR